MILDKAIKSNRMVLNISRLFRVKFSYCFFLYCVYLQPLRRSFNTISGKLNRKGLKKGLLVISFNPSTQKFHHDALNAIPEFKKTSLIKVSRTRKKLFILFYVNILQYYCMINNIKSHNLKMYFQVLIQNDMDLMNVEPYKMVIIFVDFNDRNIILENEQEEIGDLRNQITKTFLGCK